MQCFPLITQIYADKSESISEKLRNLREKIFISFKITNFEK